MSSVRSRSLVTLAKSSACAADSLVGVCLPITPQSQLRSSGDSFGPHLLSSWTRPPVGVGDGQLDQRQHDQLLAARGRTRPRRAGRNLAGWRSSASNDRQRVGRDELDRGARGLRPVGLDRQARLAPGVVGRMRCGPAATMQSAAASVQPSSASRWANQLPRTSSASFGMAAGRCAERVDQQRVAAHLAVVAHAELRVQRAKRVPVAALAEQQQPVVAQPVFLVGAGVARQEVLDLGGLCFVKARLQFPVGGPGLERMAARLRQQRARRALSPRWKAWPSGAARRRRPWICAASAQWQAPAHSKIRCQNRS